MSRAATTLGTTMLWIHGIGRLCLEQDTLTISKQSNPITWIGKMLQEQKYILCMKDTALTTALTLLSTVIMHFLLLLILIIDRKEHNVAVLELKTELQFSHNSAYLPICLPKSCGKTCRTWGRKTEDQILGRDAFSFNFLDGSIPRLDIIDNAHCKRRLNSWVPRKVKRLILHIN